MNDLQKKSKQWHLKGKCNSVVQANDRIKTKSTVLQEKLLDKANEMTFNGIDKTDILKEANKISMKRSEQEHVKKDTQIIVIHNIPKAREAIDITPHRR